MIHFTDPIFKSNFTVFTGAFEPVERYLKVRGFDLKPPRPHMARTISIEHEGRREVIFWFKKIDKSPERLAAVAHEALHGVQQQLEWIGTSPDTLKDEVANYYLEYVTRQILQKGLA